MCICGMSLPIHVRKASSATTMHRTAGCAVFISVPYQSVGPADGMTFIIQNDPAGLHALGGDGSGLGYALAPDGPAIIKNSVGLEVNIYDSTHQGTYLATQGASGIFNYLSASPVNFYAG